MLGDNYSGSCQRRDDWLNSVDNVLSWVTGLPLLFSALAHYNNPYFFLSSVYQYRLGSADFGYSVATFLPFLQIVIAVALIGRVFDSAAKIMVMLLLCMFICVQSITVIRGLNISCGCFGADLNVIGWKTVALPLGLAFVAALQFGLGFVFGPRARDVETLPVDTELLETIAT